MNQKIPLGMKCIQLMIVFSLVACAVHAQTVTEKKLPWDYPVKPGMAEWEQHKTSQERLEACQIPVDVLSTLSTEDLTDICMKNPLIIGLIFNYPPYDRGLDTLFRKFYGIKELFKREVPEIADGTVEIKAIAREAGGRTKLAVVTNDNNVDPRGACIGNSGSRVKAISNELNGEKIDIIRYSDNIEEFVTEALSPAVITNVIKNDVEKVCLVVVPDDQLSLAIGKEGQNARLAARLTGLKVDIKSETNAAEGD